MTKKGLIALLAVLLILTACGQQGTTPINPDTGDTGDTATEPQADGTVTAIESDLEYCKMILKLAQTQVNIYTRQEKIIQDNIADAKKKIADVKATGNDQVKIAEYQNDIDDLNARLKEPQAELAKAKKNLADKNTKCGKIAKKADKIVCKEFSEDLQEQTKSAQADLVEEEANLENIKKQYDTANAAGKSSEFLASINAEKEKKNLDILKIKNNIDRFGQMAIQLEERC